VTLVPTDGVVLSGTPAGKAAVRVCAAILAQVEECLAGQEWAMIVRGGEHPRGTGPDTPRGTRWHGTDGAPGMAQQGADGAGGAQPEPGCVEVRIGPGEVEGCRSDVAAALVGAHAAVVGLAGLVWARQRGRGVLAEVDPVEVIATCQGDGLARLVCPRAGVTTASDNSHTQVLRCVDGYVGVQAPSDEDRRLIEAMSEGQDFAAWVAHRPRAEVVATGQLWRLPIVRVLEPHEVTPGEPFRFHWSGQRRRCLTRGAWPLEGLRVLDLGMVWAGPYCGRLLAGLGAEVIKVEGPQRPDGTRPADAQACQGAFADLNRGKSSLVVDLSRPEGREVLLRLVGASDVLIENFSPRVMPNFGLEYDVLAQVNPGLLMLSLPAFADSQAVAYGRGLELAAGVVGWDAAGRPMSSDVAYLDYLAGCFGAIGVLAAWLRGGGAHLSVPQREVAAQVLALGGWRRHAQPGLAVDLARLGQAARGSGLIPADLTGCRHYARLPWRLAGLPHAHAADAPGFGAHTREALDRAAGLSRPEIDRLFAAGVVQ
jgi:CoA-transferase family III